MNHKTYIIIVTYNSMQWIVSCLNSAKNYEVIVVDNHSSDNTVNYIKSNFPEVMLLQQSKNLGFGAANNIGISKAIQLNCDYVFLLNQDAYLKPNTIESLISMHCKNLDYGILSPMHINSSEDALDRNFSLCLSYDYNANFYFDSVFKQLSQIYDVPFVNAAAWLLPLKILKSVGGFDPLFFHYGEDDNFCQRVLFHGYKIGIVPSSVVIHDRLIKAPKPVEIFSEKYFIDKEKKYKVNWANINTNPNQEIIQLKKSLISKINKSKLKLNFKKSRFYKKELDLVKKIECEVLKDIKLTKTKGSHFLNV